MKKIYLYFTFIVILTILLEVNAFSQCNGCYNLCAKKYDEVAYLTTHNAFSSTEDGFTFPNQTYGITQQLQDGVRALMLDVYDVNGVPTVYHSFQFLGSVPLVFNLNEIKDFLVNNPNEVVTIIFECYTDANSIEMAFIDSGLYDYLYEKNPDEDWQSLQQMIDTNKRLVVFSDKNDASIDQKWYHYVWQFAVETHFSVSNLNNFNCDFNRGNPNNDLFIFNHFITSTIGIPQISTAEEANSNPFFIDRVLECWSLHDKFPNFITVDFYHTGDCFDVVNYLNANNTISNLYNTEEKNPEIIIYPNPARDYIYISGDQGFKVVLINSSGQIIEKYNFNEDLLRINTAKLLKGVYVIQIYNMKEIITRKIVIN